MDGIVGKFNTHIFHLNACNRTNTFASQLIGRGIQLRSTSGGSFGTNTSRGMAQGTNTNRGDVYKRQVPEGPSGAIFWLRATRVSAHAPSTYRVRESPPIISGAY